MTMPQMERYFNTLKNELIYHHYFYCEEQLYMAVLDFAFLYYNHIRPNSFNKGKTPFQKRCSVTVFVNFRVESDDGSLLGVIGVGLQVASIEETILSYEKNYELSVYMVNVGGAENSFKGDTNIFVKEDELVKHTGITE